MSVLPSKFCEGNQNFAARHLFAEGKRNVTSAVTLPRPQEAATQSRTVPSTPGGTEFQTVPPGNTIPSRSAFGPAVLLAQMFPPQISCSHSHSPLTLLTRTHAQPPTHTHHPRKHSRLPRYLSHYPLASLTKYSLTHSLTHSLACSLIQSQLSKRT